MKRAGKWLGLSLVALILAGALLLAHTWYFRPLSIDWFYARVFLRFALDNPELLTRLRILEPVGIRSHNARLADTSIAHEDMLLARLRADYATLHRYDARRYTGQDRISYQVFDYFVGMQVRGERWRYHDFPVNQLFGVQSELPNLMTQIQQVNDAVDARHYLARLAEFPRRLDEVIESVRMRESKGIVPPRFVVEKVVAQIHGFVGTGGAANPLTVTFKEKLDRIPAESMDAATRAQLVGAVARNVDDFVMPSYRRLAAYIDTLRPKATRNDGAWSLPDGDLYYQYRIEADTTTTLTAAQIHELGLAEVARIKVQMERILSEAGYVDGTLAARIRALATSPAQLYPDTDEGRAQILADFEGIIGEMAAGLDRYFGAKPAAKVVVKRVPAFTEKTVAGAYYVGPPLDGSRPGTFYVNLRDMGGQPKYRMRTLTYHEAVPGHHLQTAIAQEIKGLPLFRNVVEFTAYAEGWALYAERLAWEAGFEKDPLDNLGRLQDEMLRAVRLVVDTGLHAKRWTREEAIDYMLANTGSNEPEIVTEVERYLVDPGQALAYKVGMIKIMELRERAKTALGAKFDLREFHDEVLRNGALPLAVLEQVVDAYIATR